MSKGRNQFKWYLLAVILGVVVPDQITKILVCRYIPLTYPPTVAMQIGGDIIRIIHVRNPGALFSLGDGLPSTIRRWIFVVIPLIVLTLMALYILIPQTFHDKFGRNKGAATDDLRGLGSLPLALVVGGGVGNIIDRIARPLGVVDFIDVKFWGWFGMSRWPTFNVADMSVVIGVSILLISVVVSDAKKKREQK